MPSREEIAAKVAEELEINHLCQPLTIPGSPYKRIWDALISAKVELSDREQPSSEKIEAVARRIVESLPWNEEQRARLQVQFAALLREELGGGK